MCPSTMRKSTSGTGVPVLVRSSASASASPVEFMRLQLRNGQDRAGLDMP